jgi:hypothetical protein
MAAVRPAKRARLSEVPDDQPAMSDEQEIEDVLGGKNGEDVDIDEEDGEVRDEKFVPAAKGSDLYLDTVRSSQSTLPNSLTLATDQSSSPRL